MNDVLTRQLNLFPLYKTSKQKYLHFIAIIIGYLSLSNVFKG
jgi:hypothetical protein